MTGQALRHGLEFALHRGVTGLLVLLPEGVALRLGAALGWVVGTVLRVRRRVVDEHLAFAFPERDARWRARVARASYAHLGREAVAVFRLARMDAQALVARTTVEGFDAFQAALAEGRGLILVSGHVGNWEVGGASYAARGLAVDAVVKGMANRRFDQDLVASRARLGVRVVEISQAAREVPRGLREGHVVGFIADQDAREHGVFVPFLGRSASTFRGPALFALRTGAPIFVGACLREPGWPQRYRIVAERLPVEPSGDLEDDVLRLTRAHTRVLEAAVRQAPEQYFWQHKRWKTRPRGAPHGARGADGTQEPDPPASVSPGDGLQP